MALEGISTELLYLLIVVGLFIVPRVFQRFRVPAAITSVGIGMVLGLGVGWSPRDSALPLLATLGIVALFLFAGLEVDFRDLRRGMKVTIGYLLLQLGLLALGAWGVASLFGLPWRAALLFALAVFTPSTGFILDSLSAFGLDEPGRFWVKTKAISSELVALAALFLVVQSSSVDSLAVSTAALAAMVVALPWIFQFFASRILPWAPGSEFAFLVILALVCAYVTRHLGVYYLVGAFLVGVTAVRLQRRLPALASERLIIGIELFASFFIPFYFFKAGLHLERDIFTRKSLGIGLTLVGVGVPLRVGVVAAYRRMMLAEPWKDCTRIGISLVPTLVFSLVLANILRERYRLGPEPFGGLVVYALVNTILPGVILRRRNAPVEAKPTAPTSDEGDSKVA